MKFLNKNKESGGLNLELALIIGLLVLTSVFGLTFMGGKISNAFIAAGGSVKAKANEEGTTIASYKTTIKDTGGTVMPGLKLSLVKDGATVASGTSDANGLIDFTNVPSGTYDVVVTDTNYVPVGGSNTERVADTVTLSESGPTEIVVNVTPVLPAISSIQTFTKPYLNGNAEQIVLEYHEGSFGYYEIQTSAAADFNTIFWSQDYSDSMAGGFIPLNIPASGFVSGKENFYRIRVKGESNSDWSPTLSLTKAGARWTADGPNVTVTTTNTTDDWKIDVYGSNVATGDVPTTTPLETINVAAGNTKGYYTMTSDYLRYKFVVTSLNDNTAFTLLGAPKN